MQNGTNNPETQAPAAYQVDPRYEAPPRRRRDLPYKTPFLAGFLSILPGLGHIYVGYFRQGLVVASSVAMWIVLITAQISGLLPVAIVGLVFTVFYGIIDAVRRAQMYNLALDNNGQIPSIQNLEAPGRRGSMAGGVILIVLGTMVFLNLQFDIDMEWLEDWWPVGLIALGIWLVVKARGEKGQDSESASGYHRTGGDSSGL